MSQSTVLITGGSSGIGYATSQHFAKAGYRILWVSLLQAELEASKQTLEKEVEGVEIHALQLDLSQPEAPQQAFDWTKENGWQVDVLINNAGIGSYGYLFETDLDREMALINLNMVCLYKMTRLFLDEMIPRNAGTLINISSNSSFFPTPRLNTYASSKAFVRHWTRGLSEELKMAGSKVRAITICPAAIRDTAFRKSNDMDRLKTFSGLATTTAEEVSRDIWYAFKNGKSFRASGWKMRFLFILYPFLPNSLKYFLIKQETAEIS